MRTRGTTGRRRTAVWHCSCFLSIGFEVLLAGIGRAHAQAMSATTAAESRPPDDLTHGRRLLQDVRDGVPSFDEPAFYWWCRWTRSAGASSQPAFPGGGSPDSWDELAAEPRRHRGATVTLEGVLLARHAYTLPNRASLGELYECILSDSRSPLLATVVCVDEPSGMHIGARVRARGVFIKHRRFQTRAGQTGAGPLLIARRLEPAPAPPPAATAGDGSWATGWLLPATAVAAVLWLVLRRRTAARVPPARPPDHRPRENDDHEPFDWMDDTPRPASPPADA
jgi:hypothetical protein